jgi:hypothetical protein
MFMVSFATVFINIVTREASVIFTDCVRYHSTFEIARKNMKNVTFIYYLNTLLLPIFVAEFVGSGDVFSADWYYNVGVVITTSVLFSSLLVFTEQLVGADCFFGICRRNYDQGCNCSPKR